MANWADPNRQPETFGLTDSLMAVYGRHQGNREGAPADHIPELARVEPDLFGVAIATVGGALHAVGDAHIPFTIQSASKPFIYCLALELAGRDAVTRKVGVQPSGDAPHSIVFDATGRPFNPMVNGGAVTICGILRYVVGPGAFDLILERLSEAAGRPLAVDEAVYRSESESGHRDRAIGHLLQNFGALDGPVDEVLDIYFRQCSIMVSANDLARMGATLAHVGENPITGRQVFDPSAVRAALALMLTCGMYDSSGHWAFDVGVPAKGGIGGGIVGVANRRLGVAAYSPRLDAKGNSVRGAAALRDLAAELGLHAFECSNVAPTQVGADSVQTTP
jgi:glutaminase